MQSSSVRILLPRTAGTNCDQELAWAFEQSGATVTKLHINRLMDDPAQLQHHHILALAGGFSYGDDIASGKIFANQLVHHLKSPLEQWVRDGKLIIGICNGFQILVKAGLLPGPLPQFPPEDIRTATLTHNSHARFEDRWVRLKTFSKHCKWVQPGQLLRLPIAHGEGRFMVRSPEVLAALQQNDQIVLRYVNADGHPTGDFPDNPNGSTDAIAGICDITGRVLGLMPHPERFTDMRQAPDWTRQPGQPASGMHIFQNAVDYVRGSQSLEIQSAQDSSVEPAAAIG